MVEKNKLGDLLTKENNPYLFDSEIQCLNQILTCEKHGRYRRYQSPYSNIDCPICDELCEQQYYRDGRRFSYWPSS